MLNTRIRYFLLASLFIFSSCKTQWQIEDIEGTRIKLDDTYDKPVDSTVMSIIQHYKVLLDKQMNEVIGKASTSMSTGLPESQLTNLTADALLEWGNRQQEEICDFSVMNYQGIRANLNAGDITLGNMFELYPFENRLAIVELKGQYVEDLLKYFARKGGEGISSTVKLEVRNKDISSLTIGGKPLDKGRVYRIVTIDYIAEGNDGMKAFQFSEKTAQTNILLRDVMIEYVKEQTAKGNTLQATIDGRIKIIGS